MHAIAIARHNIVPNPHRCEHFNSIMREYNIHGNRKACSRDVVTRFARLEAIRLLKEGDGSGRNRYIQAKAILMYIYIYFFLFRCGAALHKLLDSPEVVHFLYGTPYRDILSHKEIYQPGTLRKVIAKGSTVT